MNVRLVICEITIFSLLYLYKKKIVAQSQFYLRGNIGFVELTQEVQSVEF